MQLARLWREHLAAGCPTEVAGVEIAGSEFTLPADLVLLAMGFVGPRKAGLLES